MAKKVKEVKGKDYVAEVLSKYIARSETAKTNKGYTPNNIRTIVIAKDYIGIVYFLGNKPIVQQLDRNRLIEDPEYLEQQMESGRLRQQKNPIVKALTGYTQRVMACLEELYIADEWVTDEELQLIIKKMYTKSSRLRYVGRTEGISIKNMNDIAQEMFKSSTNRKSFDVTIYSKLGGQKGNSRVIDLGNKDWYTKHNLKESNYAYETKIKLPKYFEDAEKECSHLAAEQKKVDCVRNDLMNLSETDGLRCMAYTYALFMNKTNNAKEFSEISKVIKKSLRDDLLVGKKDGEFTPEQLADAVDYVKDFDKTPGAVYCKPVVKKMYASIKGKVSADDRGIVLDVKKALQNAIVALIKSGVILKDKDSRCAFEALYYVANFPVQYSDIRDTSDKNDSKEVSKNQYERRQRAIETIMHIDDAELLVTVLSMLVGYGDPFDKTGKRKLTFYTHMTKKVCN